MALDLDDVTKTLQDAAYVSIGLGVIAFQRAQVRRQELRKTLDERVGEAKSTADAMSGLVEDRVKMLEERLAAVEEQVETAVERLESTLPGPVAEASRTARGTAKVVRDQVRDQVRQLAK
jgi:E3 ubiquitin-protein ligase DOA10